MMDYKVVTVSDKTGFISANHQNQELLVSSDINVNWTEDGKLCATFPNHRKTEPTFADFVRDLCGKRDESESSDCSIVISEPAYFNHCIKKDGAYELSGSKVTFNGTDKDDKLTLKEVSNSKINMGNGDDTLLIEGAPHKSRFFNNIIKMGNGDDTVNSSGDFKYFYNNQFYLGKGSDYFGASINPSDDAKTQFEYESRLPKYGATVAKNEVYAIDGYTGDGDKKEWFEANVFESKTHSANQLFRYEASTGTISGIDGFQLYRAKPEPLNPIKVSEKKEIKQPAQENKTSKIKPKITKEDCLRRYWVNSMLLWLGNKEAAEGLTQALNDWLDLMK